MVLPNLEEFRGLPRFSDGRIDYSNAQEAVGVYVIVKFEKEILLLKRSLRVSSLQGEWFFCSGFIDETTKHIEDKAVEELREETGITRQQIRSIRYLDQILVEENGLWNVHLVIVELKEKPSIVLDWEHDEYCWASYDKALTIITRVGAKQAIKKVRQRKVL